MAVKSIWHSQNLIVAKDLIALHTNCRNLAVTVEGKSMGLVRSLVAAPCLLLLAACGAASEATNETTTNAPVSGNAVSATPIPAPSDPSAFKLGTNLARIDWWDGSRPFMNLFWGSGWQWVSPAWVAADLPAANLDSDGWPNSAPAGYKVVHGLSVPVAGGDIVCRYQGSGAIEVAGPVSNVSYAPGVVRFTVPATYPNPQGARLSWTVDPVNYIKNVDCREANATATTLMAPEFLAAAKGFKVVRFMKWQQATEQNWPVTWAHRNKPNGGDYTLNDGVPVEYLVQAANELDVDPWVTVPWNADNEWITSFATYFRDHMAPGHQVYVEVSNEVWNAGYPVTVQAAQEARDEGLIASDGSGRVGWAGERYAEKTRQVMAIWSTVFSGQSNRLVRVFAWQNVMPSSSANLLAYQDTYKSVDALATAPYFGDDSTFDGQTLDQIIGSLPAKVDTVIGYAAQQKAVAQKFGLRYVGYEAGQSVVLPTNIALETQVQRDPRMYDIYKQFISGWQSKVGDTLTLFNLTGGVSKYGGWGMWEYAGQPISSITPKMRAVQEFLGVTTASADPITTPTPPTTSTTPVITASTQICPDGTVVALTGSCPVAPLPSPTNNGKRKSGTGKGGRNATALA
jgi:hypothetical protein